MHVTKGWGCCHAGTAHATEVRRRCDEGTRMVSRFACDEGAGRRVGRADVAFRRSGCQRVGWRTVGGGGRDGRVWGGTRNGRRRGRRPRRAKPCARWCRGRAAAWLGCRGAAVWWDAPLRKLSCCRGMFHVKHSAPTSGNAPGVRGTRCGCRDFAGAGACVKLTQSRGVIPTNRRALADACAR